MGLLAKVAGLSDMAKSLTTILHIITGLNDGGAEAVLYRLCKHDTFADHRVISLMDAGKYGPMLQSQGVQVTCLNMPKGRLTVSGLWKLYRLIIKQKPDVVQTWMYHANLLGGLAAWLSGHRNIIWGIHHSTLEQSENSRSTIAVARSCAWLSRIVPKKILFCAKKAINTHAAIGYCSKRMIFVPNGYDLAAFRPDNMSRASVRTELGLGSGPVVGFIARYDPLKDHDNLLHALRLLKYADRRPICLLVGTGMDHDNNTLADTISNLGLSDQVRLLGRRDDVPRLMNALDLHVMSSVSEAFPNVLAEAMACGTPCVSTDVGDAAAIIGETGWIVPPREPQALANAIALALEAQEKPEWIERQASARIHIETRFSIDQMVIRYRAVWLGTPELRKETEG